MTTTTEPLVTTDYFESVYAEAGGDATRVPWESGHASKALVNWLNAVAPSLIRCGARVGVVGCGLGADAREVARRGYDMTAFDCSGTAIEWARRLDPGHAGCYVQADLFDPPPRWIHRFDLVIDVNNLHTLGPGLHNEALAAAARLLSPHGHLLVVCRGAEERTADETASLWPLTERELWEATGTAGLAPQGPICCFTDDENVARIRAVFRRA